jgi:hypothetical protein
MRIRSTLAVTAAITASLFCAGTAGAKVYYLDVMNDTIAEANASGQVTDSSMIPVGRNFSPCCTMNFGGFGLATDGPHIYWSNNDYVSGTRSSIGRATLDSTGDVIEDSIDPTFVMLPGAVRGITAEAQPDGSTLLFWVHRPPESGSGGIQGIGRMQIDAEGAVVEESINPNFITGASDPLHIDVDNGNGFWSNNSTDSIGHFSYDTDGDLIGTPDPLAIPHGDEAPLDPLSEPDVVEPTGVAVKDGYVYWGNDRWKNLDAYRGRGDGHELGRAPFAADGELTGPVENLFITGVGSYQYQFTGTQTPNGVATDGAYVYWANGGIPLWSDKDDDIGRAPLTDPMGPAFRYSFIRTEFVTSIVAQRDANVGADCPTSKLTVVTCTITVSDDIPTGAEAPSGRVLLTASGDGTWANDGECLLSQASATSSTCVMEYTREGDGGELITAQYTGDDAYSASGGETALLPKQKDPPPPDSDPILPDPPGDGKGKPGSDSGPGATGTGTSSKKCKKKNAKKSKKKKKCKKRRKS